MRHSTTGFAVILALSPVQQLLAAETSESEWSATSNVTFVSDYYARGISQNWHKPTVQGGIDLTHSSGFYTGIWGSGVTPNTFVDANTEIDVYAGFNGSIAAIDKLGYTVGLISYLYPGGSWKKYSALTLDKGKPSGDRFNTTEINVGLSYDWISAKASYTLTNWFGAEKATGWDGSSKGTVYLELNAAYPLPLWDLILVGHLGHLDVAARLEASGFPNANGTPGTYKTNPDYTDWKVGLSKGFKLAGSEGWSAGIYYVGASNNGYWGGYGGSSFAGSTHSDGSLEYKNLNDSRFVFTLGRAF